VPKRAFQLNVNHADPPGRLAVFDAMTVYFVKAPQKVDCAFFGVRSACRNRGAPGALGGERTQFGKLRYARAAIWSARFRTLANACRGSPCGRKCFCSLRIRMVALIRFPVVRLGHSRPNLDCRKLADASQPAVSLRELVDA